jgi:sugar (pentulose or hexulose) kinase
MSAQITIGIDLGTSGVRAAALSSEHMVVGTASQQMPTQKRRDPTSLILATKNVLAKLATQIDGPVSALAICGTSGSFVPLDHHGHATGPNVLYSDRASSDIVTQIAKHAPKSSPVHGAHSPLAKIISTNCSNFAFEADYVASWLTGKRVPCDANNALKAGGDPLGLGWPNWIEQCGATRKNFPDIVEPGTPIGSMSQTIQKELGFQTAPVICAGTTDGCAAALAAGLKDVGDAVTSLGTSLTLKILSDRPIVSVPHGIYSHRLLGMWLVGGASNAGGAAIRAHFDDDQVTELMLKIDTTRKFDLNYMPLLRSGERFPVFDPYLMPRFDPQPKEDTAFLHAILESLVRVEKIGFTVLQANGAPAPVKIAAVGNGTKNKAWMRIRERELSAPLANPLFIDPACGAAILAGIGSNV